MFKIKHRTTGDVLFEFEVSRPRDFRNLDLKNADLKGLDLMGCDFSGSVLNDATLKNSDMTGALLKDASLINADLSESIIIGASFTGSDLTRASLALSVVKRTDLSFATLANTNLNRAILSGCETFKTYYAKIETGYEGTFGWHILMQFDPAYPHDITHDELRFGCEAHPIDNWTPSRTSSRIKLHRPTERTAKFLRSLVRHARDSKKFFTTVC